MPYRTGHTILKCNILVCTVEPSTREYPHSDVDDDEDDDIEKYGAMGRVYTREQIKKSKNHGYFIHIFCARSTTDRTKSPVIRVFLQL
jgi:hypothetical protein